MGTAPRAQIEARRKARSERNVQIWRRARRSEKLSALAKEFGLSKGTVWSITRKVDWLVDFALKNRQPNSQPYIYDTWFHFELGKPEPRIEP